MTILEIERGDEQARLIAEQNDRFRTSWGADASVPGRIVMTPGVADLGPLALLRLIVAVRNFDAFSADNDPWGQRDFGIVAVGQGGETVRVYFKIDLYDADYTFGSEAPEDPERTRRVLTLLLPEEY
ncbi:DUF3768 domain-containing protein [Amaricoccus solimangrovi]|uniref:DUF3768 domain-containing protein n=1 Tax=Amaricoccus solimangrovi TaxID=2589815 RepID=A0A501WIF2_9RHOB|nr:DUF3768 domain-containing protein [Amaricoccus solimangrovi]TPE47884.1 DUF3768 domain-containing protein [Amaricoccus solimangrovi]